MGFTNPAIVRMNSALKRLTISDDLGFQMNKDSGLKGLKYLIVSSMETLGPTLGSVLTPNMGSRGRADIRTRKRSTVT